MPMADRDSEVEPELGVPDPVAGVVGEMLLRRRSDLVDSLGCKVVWCGSVDSLQPGKTVTAILHEVGQDGKVPCKSIESVEMSRAPKIMP